MSDGSVDVEELIDLIGRLRNVGERLATMSGALRSFPVSGDYPANVDLAGVRTAATTLDSLLRTTVSQYDGLVGIAKDLGKADKSWGDHVKGWLTPPKTHVDWLDRGLEVPANVGAGVTDAGYGLGAGVVSLTDIVRPSKYKEAQENGEPPPYARPGLGLINLGLHPLDSGKGIVGWQYHHDPDRMGGYAVANLATMLATGGLGEAAEATMAARLARLEGLSADVARLESRLAKVPKGRRGSSSHRTKARKRHRNAARELEQARARHRILDAKIANAARWHDPLTALRHSTPAQIASAIQSLGQSLLVKWLRNHNHRTAATGLNTVQLGGETGEIGNQGQEARREAARRRLDEIAVHHVARGLR
jgi:hypothetical protein